MIHYLQIRPLATISGLPEDLPMDGRSVKLSKYNVRKDLPPVGNVCVSIFLIRACGVRASQVWTGHLTWPIRHDFESTCQRRQISKMFSKRTQ
ncbi:hypothetical protein AVEN_131071-1 [Araneus ventricosus]|uniref:Uncharacterized protein n=1 Tax=Araneus ventricosus TaxID=182803 RepID=A0A4Y2D0P6_ARAVE|nr:hypothetical protein AVEN_131071-1 [Araneus ventricosus]